MTRGTGYLITWDYYYTHDEFNGDMYRKDGNGEDFISMLNQTTPENFEEELRKWNKANHNYNDFGVYKELIVGKEIRKENHELVVDFSKYFPFWFSDYSFIKNGTDKQIKIITASDMPGIAGQTIYMEPNETRAFYFGGIEDSYTAEEVKKEKEIEVK